MSWHSIFCIGKEKKELVKWIVEHDTLVYLGDVADGKNEEAYYFLSVEKLRKIKSIMEEKHKTYMCKLQKVKEDTLCTINT